MRKILFLCLLLFVLSCSEEAQPPVVEKIKDVAVNEFSEFGWRLSEVVTLRSLWLESLPPLPSDPSNAVADKPEAAALGKKIFFDSQFSLNGKISCATCHQEERFFTDGLDRSRGLKKTKRGAPTIIGTAYSPWLFWNGRADSHWAQALGPLENKREHGGTRAQYAHILFNNKNYRTAYENIFGVMPDISDKKRFPEHAGPVDDSKAEDAWDDMTDEDREIVTRIFVNMGKAIAAFERQIMPRGSRFDAYVKALLAKDQAAMSAALNKDEVNGLRLFITKGTCINCHNGPLFTNNSFHNIGVPTAKGLTNDWGRTHGVSDVMQSDFNCLGEYSDARTEDCAELQFAKKSGSDFVGAFKVPTLRNVAETAPYMRAGQLKTLEQVIKHYNVAPMPAIGHSMLAPLKLTDSEISQLNAFLGSLSDLN